MSNAKPLMTQLQEHFENTGRPQFARVVKELSEQPWRDRLSFWWERYNTLPFFVRDENNNDNSGVAFVVFPTTGKHESPALKLTARSVADGETVVHDGITPEEIVAVVESWIMKKPSAGTMASDP